MLFVEELDVATDRRRHSDSFGVDSRGSSILSSNSNFPLLSMLTAHYLSGKIAFHVDPDHCKLARKCLLSLAWGLLMSLQSLGI